jgi:hypothetical protein
VHPAFFPIAAGSTNKNPFVVFESSTFHVRFSAAALRKLFRNQLTLIFQTKQNKMSCFSVKCYFCSAEGSPGVELSTLVDPDNLIFSANLVECGGTAPDLKNLSVPSWRLTTAEADETDENIHFLFNLKVWKSQTSLDAGHKADQEDTLFHIVSKLPYLTVLENIALVFRGTEKKLVVNNK